MWLCYVVWDNFYCGCMYVDNLWWLILYQLSDGGLWELLDAL